MSRLDSIFERLRVEDRTAFIPYITCGDPTLARTEELVLRLDACGADLIELGVPFSDPLADGPTIQAASRRALAAGTTLTRIIELIGRVRGRVSAGLVVFTYYNPVFRYGLERFCQDAALAGADGVLVPDLPPDEAAPLLQHAGPADLDVIFLIAPTSTDERIRRAGEAGGAFVYAVSLTGVTGARDELPADLTSFVERGRAQLDGKPLVVGFGISTRDQAAQVAQIADGVVVGSALVKVVAEAGDSDELADRVAALAEELIAGVREE